MSRATIRFVIQDVHMGLGHIGLSKIIAEQKKRNKLFAQTLRQSGGLILFINTKRTACKVMADGGEVMGYFRPLNGAKITEQSIDMIPATFGGASFELAGAVKSALKKLLDMEKSRKDYSSLASIAG